jgi:asparagine synthase (glutamine-hydrolysing)
MCGIAGIVSLGGRPVGHDRLAAMTAALRHRGPDGAGDYIDDAVGLGHRRLAVIDLTDNARQPMTGETGDVVVTYNGEIYNFRALREQLESLGHRFRSSTDAEVVVHGFEEWGAACVERFNGMFAFAAWDRRVRTLTLARDRYGIKPLYYTRLAHAFLFASEIKAFLAHPDFRVRVSAPHLLEYFTFQNIFTDGTLFDGVTLLPAGTVLTVRCPRPTGSSRADGTGTTRSSSPSGPGAPPTTRRSSAPASRRRCSVSW